MRDKQISREDCFSPLSRGNRVQNSFNRKRFLVIDDSLIKEVSFQKHFSSR